MSILEVTDMTQGFGEKVIFNNVSFRLLKGEHIGLVGANGEGKTTFMKLITGEILPDKGDISWNSKVSIGYMDQNVQLNSYIKVKDVLNSAFSKLYKLEEKLERMYKRVGTLSKEDMEKSLNQIANIQEILEESDFYSIDSRVEGIANGLGISNLLDKSPMELSGGQRTKVLLGKLLLEKPDILLLDEPTNHLDEENIAWLRSHLINYENAFILISHDNEFLNSVVNVIYHLENKILTRYHGNYEKFLTLYELRKEQLLIDYNKQQKEILKLEEYIRKNKVRTATAAQAKSREKKLEKIERIHIDKKKPKPQFNFQYSKNPWKLLFETKELVIGYDKPLTIPLNLSMNKGDKIAIVGANGIGKTTLLRSLMGIIEPLSGTVNLSEYLDIGYYEQEVECTNDNKVIDYMWDEFPKMNKTEIRRILAKCGLTNEHIDSEISLLSGGEQAKVRLCKILNNKTNILFLDEPTNHLDIEAKNELKRALIDYEGSVVIVSHEPEFYKGIINKIWDCEEWKYR